MTAVGHPDDPGSKHVAVPIPSPCHSDAMPDCRHSIHCWCVHLRIGPTLNQRHNTAASVSATADASISPGYAGSPEPPNTDSRPTKYCLDCEPGYLQEHPNRLQGELTDHDSVMFILQRTDRQPPAVGTPVYTKFPVETERLEATYRTPEVGSHSYYCCCCCCGCCLYLT